MTESAAGGSVLTTDGDQPRPADGDQPRPVPRSRAAMRDALELVARVERDSRALRRLDIAAGSVALSGSWAVRADAADVASLALAPAVDGLRADPGLPPVGASAVLVGRPSSRLRRLRAFYPGAGLTAAVHGNLPLGRRSGLLAGASVLERLSERGPLVLPRVVDRGRRLRHAWVVEDLLDGARMPAHEFRGLLPELLGELAALWLRGGEVDRVRASTLLDARIVAAVRELGQRPGIDATVERLAAALERLAAQGGDVLVGWCHGDPVHGNWLRLRDGRIALIDWELARRRPLGHDAMKALVAAPDPLGALAPAGSRLVPHERRRDLPWPLQVATVLARWLAGWREERAIFERSGTLDAWQRRIDQRIRLLGQLLDQPSAS